eukprot:Sspe_Gene.36821::Locus_17796_Transcript_1_1_Confidence_1.000_Length_1088::g.36821::m.36821
MEGTAMRPPATEAEIAAGIEALSKVDPKYPTKAWEQLTTSGTIAGNPQELDIDEFWGLSPPPEGHLRVVCVSDTHGMERRIKSIPDGDVLVHAGDITNQGEQAQLRRFNEWLGDLPHKHKVVIAGNHDLSLDGDWVAKRRTLPPDEVRAAVEKTKALLTNVTHYLEDSSAVIDGVHFWGSPSSPEFCDWGFNLPRGDACRLKWAECPEGTDVMITHGPPIGRGDLCSSGDSAGCVDLLQTLYTIRPKYHVSGHIHEGYGVYYDGVTTCLNASICDLRYRPVHKPLVFDVKIRR